MDPIGGPIPFRVAQAYARHTPRPSAVEPASPARNQPGEVSQLHTPAVRRLVAGTVPGGVDFSGDQARPGAATLQFYRHPADRNAAATGVELGRSLDVQA